MTPIFNAGIYLLANGKQAGAEMVESLCSLITAAGQIDLDIQEIGGILNQG
jgi:hypothetical protein